ncbi:MAG: MFS transporter [Chloroflexi bacterium]|nr:MFS transporter [Chloroflexota bacterium]
MFKQPGIFYGWIIVIAAFMILFITSGINFSYGVFYLPIINEFGWTRGLTAGVVMVAGLIYAATLPFTGILADRYDYRWIMVVATGLLSLGLMLSSQIQNVWQLYIFSGILVGLSLSASFAIPVALVAVWFRKRQGLAVGTATVGISLGTALIPLLITYLISAGGWRLTYLIAGIVVAVICVPAALAMRKPGSGELTVKGGSYDLNKPVDKKQVSAVESETGLTLKQALGTKEFWMLFVIFAFFLLSLGLVILHIVPYAIDSGLSPVAAAGLLTVIGVLGIAGRLVAGLVSDRIGAKPVILFCLILETVIITWIAFSRDVWTFYIFAALFGIAYPGFVTMMVRITRQLFGFKSLGAIFGMLMISDGIGTGVGPWLAGYAFDVTGSYRVPLFSVAAGLVIAAIITVIIKPPVTKTVAEIN